MRLRDKIRATAVTGLLAAGTLAVTASPALAANAPGCIDVYPTSHHTSVNVANNCPQGAGYYLRVIWAAAPDSGCFWLASGQRTRGQWRFALSVHQLRQGRVVLTPTRR